MGKSLSFEERTEILRLAKTNLTQAEIARRMGCSRPTVGRVIARGEVGQRRSFKRQVNTRMTQDEVDALQAIADAQGISASEAVRFLVRNAAGLLDIRGAEAKMLREVSRELNALARNLVALLQLGRSDRLQWQKRDEVLMDDLASRVEVLARALQTYRAAGDRNARVKVADLPEFVSDG